MARPLILQDEAIAGGLQRDAAGDRKFQSFRQLENMDVIFDPVVSLRRRQAFGSFTDITFPYNLMQVYVTVLKGIEVVFLVDVQGNIHRLLGNHIAENINSYAANVVSPDNYVQITVNSTNGLKHKENVVIAGSSISDYNGTFTAQLNSFTGSYPTKTDPHTHHSTAFLILPENNAAFQAATDGTWYRDTIIHDMKATDPATSVGDLPDQVYFETVDDRVYFTTHTLNGEQGYYVVGTERATNFGTDDWDNIYFPVPVSMPSFPKSYTSPIPQTETVETVANRVGAIMPWRPFDTDAIEATSIREDSAGNPTGVGLIDAAQSTTTFGGTQLAQWIRGPVSLSGNNNDNVDTLIGPVIFQTVDLLLYQSEGANAYGRIRVKICPDIIVGGNTTGSPNLTHADTLTSEWLTADRVYHNDSIGTHPKNNSANSHTANLGAYGKYPYLTTTFTFEEASIFDVIKYQWLVLEGDDEYYASLSSSGTSAYSPKGAVVRWHQALNEISASIQGWWVNTYQGTLATGYPSIHNNVAIGGNPTWITTINPATQTADDYTSWYEIGSSLFGSTTDSSDAVSYAAAPYSSFEKSEGDLSTDKQSDPFQPLLHQRKFNTIAQGSATFSSPNVTDAMCINTIPRILVAGAADQWHNFDGRVNQLSIYRTSATVSAVEADGVASADSTPASGEARQYNESRYLIGTDYRFVGRSGNLQNLNEYTYDAMDNDIVSASTTGKDPLIRSLVDADENPIAPTAIKHWQDRLWIVTGNKVRWSDRIEDVSPLGITGDPNYYSYNITNEWDFKNPVTGLSVYNDRLLVSMRDHLYTFTGGTSVLNPPPDLALMEVTTTEGITNSDSIVEAAGMLMFVNQFGHLKAFTGQERTNNLSEPNQSLWNEFKKWKSVLHEEQLYVAVSTSASSNSYDEIHILDLSRRQPYWRVYSVADLTITDLSVTSSNRLIATYYNGASTGILSFNGHSLNTETGVTATVETHPTVNPNGDRSRWTGFSLKGKYPSTPPSIVVTATGEEGKTSSKTIIPVNTADIRNESGGLRLISETCRLQFTSTANTLDEFRYIELR